MAIQPPLPDPNVAKEFPHERHLRDRAVFLGEFGRSDPNQRTRDSKDRNKKAFDACLDEADGDKDSPVQTKNSPGEDLSTENAQDAEVKSKVGGEHEARRHAGAFHTPNPLLGLAMPPEFLRPPSAPIGAAEQSGAQKKTRKNEDLQSDPASAPVDPAILSQLREAGLVNPVSGFHDSRIREEHALLSVLDGWREEAIPGGRSYHWQASGPRFQRIRLTGTEGLIESSSGTHCQVIEKTSQGTYHSKRTEESGSPGFSPPG